jgi:hypothetical protein
MSELLHLRLKLHWNKLVVGNATFACAENLVQAHLPAMPAIPSLAYHVVQEEMLMWSLGSVLGKLSGDHVADCLEIR